MQITKPKWVINATVSSENSNAWNQVFVACDFTLSSRKSSKLQDKIRKKRKMRLNCCEFKTFS